MAIKFMTDESMPYKHTEILKEAQLRYVMTKLKHKIE